RRVTIKGLWFMPAEVVVAPDHTVSWINRDLVSHNKQAVGGTNDGCDDSGSADPPSFTGRARDAAVLRQPTSIGGTKAPLTYRPFPTPPRPPPCRRSSPPTQAASQFNPTST